MLKVGIIGCGVVGTTLKDWFINNAKHDLRLLDPPKGFEDDLSDCDTVFVCINVATCQDTESKMYYQDMGLLGKVVNEYKNVPVFIKSTVLPGTCDELGVHAMPEFLTERTCDLDFFNQDIIVGNSDKHRDLLEKLFPNKKIHYTSNKEAELIKYAHNCFAAVKVNYFNMVHDLCKRLLCDYNKVRDGVLMSNLISPNHTSVPGPDGKYGYGGKCLPKDLKAFISFVGIQEDMNLPQVLLATTSLSNDYYRNE